MCMTLTLNSEISDRRYHNDLTNEDINIIYSALLNYGKNIADRHRIGRTDQAALRRTDRLAEVFRICGQSVMSAAAPDNCTPLTLSV